MRRTIFAAVASAMTLLPVAAHAGPPSGAGNNPRDYIPAPVGTTAMVTYWKHISGNKYYANQNKASSGAGISADVFILRPVHWMKVGSLVFDPQCLIIGQDTQVDGGGGATGFSDLVTLAAFWVVNKPERKLWLALTPYITIPIGEYDKNNPGNSPGANRWTLRPEIGLAKGFGENLYLDLTGSVEWFQDNDEYAGMELSQNLQYHAEAHVSYDFTKSFYGGVDYYGYFGGETELDGVAQNDKKNNHAIGWTGAYQVAAGQQLMLQWKDDVSVKDGAKANTFMLRYLTAW